MGFSDLTFIQSDRRLELLDALYQISQSAQFASYYPDMPDQDWEMCSSTCVEATLFRHALQAAFAFLDGTISDVREVMNMVDKDRRRQREWLAEKRIKRYGFSHDPVKADTTRHRRDPAGSSSDPCLARFHHTPSTIPSPLNKPTPSSTISSTLPPPHLLPTSLHRIELGQEQLALRLLFENHRIELGHLTV
ncbi:hypothetical protein VNI00_019431 [Paramarasmius palmivorus]|uniref:Uncharacterized protein n=1 Tax=Paramarasmius palmivorus TaxID=297713 RepID=A0AAW0AM03_9AGAR